MRPGQDNLLFTYRNAQTGGWFTLEIQPQNSSTSKSGPESPTNATVAAPSAMQPTSPGPASPNAAGNQLAGPTASANTAGNQPPGTDQVAWQTQKNGASFILTVTGSLSDDELGKVVASVH